MATRPVDKSKYPIPPGGKFGDPRDGGARKHVGTDYLTPIGIRSKASKSGRVAVIDSNSARGKFIRLKNSDGTQSLQQHLKSVLVSVGQRVKEGQIIAVTGDTGVGGPHIHVEEFNKSGINVDPEKVYAKDMVTLTQLNVIYRFLLGKSVSDYAREHYLGKVSFETAYRNVKNSTSFAREVKVVKANPAEGRDHLPNEMR